MNRWRRVWPSCLRDSAFLRPGLKESWVPGGGWWSMAPVVGLFCRIYSASGKRMLSFPTPPLLCLMLSSPPSSSPLVSYREGNGGVKIFSREGNREGGCTHQSDSWLLSHFWGHQLICLELWDHPNSWKNLWKGSWDMSWSLSLPSSLLLLRDIMRHLLSQTWHELSLFCGLITPPPSSFLVWRRVFSW